MHHLLLDHWSHRCSPIHSLDGRIKLAALLLFLPVLSLSTGFGLPMSAVALFIITRLSQLPIRLLLMRAALVLPFSALIALTNLDRALLLLSKSYLSALAALLFAATTPLEVWTCALRAWHVPATLVSVLQFVYRYLFVVTEEAQTMLTAARARGGYRFSAAVGALAVLFARSWQRAESVHRAMLARGYQP